MDIWKVGLWRHYVCYNDFFHVRIRNDRMVNHNNDGGFKLYKLLYPLSTSITVRRMKLFVLSCWVATLLIPAAWSSPYAVRYFSLIGNCVLDNTIRDRSLLFVIGPVVIILNFILLIASNCAILWIVKSRSRTGSIGKALRLILTISSLFLISNILVVYLSIHIFLGSLTENTNRILTWSYLMFQFNTFINPIMYCFMQPSFKNYVVKMMKRKRRIPFSV